MSSSTSTAPRAEASATVLPRWMILLRAGLLLAVGFVIAFSATLHETFAFDVAIVTSGLALIGAVHCVEWTQRRGKTGAPVALLLGAVSIVAAVVMISLSNELAFAIVISAWALVCALLEFMGMTVSPGSRQDAIIVGAAGMLLAVLVLIFRDDAVAVIGFFGGYAVIAGVFLGIAGFDPRQGNTVIDTAETAGATATAGTAVNAGHSADVSGAQPAAQTSPAATQLESE